MLLALLMGKATPANVQRDTLGSTAKTLSEVGRQILAPLIHAKMVEHARMLVELTNAHVPLGLLAQHALIKQEEVKVGKTLATLIHV